MEYAVVGDADDGPQLDLDHRAFAYAGKFVLTNTGKAVAREDGDLVAAASFNADRTDATTGWIRYVTVRTDRRGEGIGPRLAAFLASALLDGDEAGITDAAYDRVRIAVNNPFAFHAMHRAGFGWTGERTGIAELVLERPGDRSRYAEGLAAYEEREDLADAERAFLADHADDEPPSLVETPK